MTHDAERPQHRVWLAENLLALSRIPDGAADLIYIDPPFNTGATRTKTSLRTRRDESAGTRNGFAGKRYQSTRIGSVSFDDAFDDYLAFLEPRLIELHRALSATGSMYVHLDYREAHRCKILLDAIFGPASFLNEIIWAYDFGGRTNKRWPPKHDTILVYVKDPRSYTFNADAVERIPYMAPGLVGPDKAARGKLPTDTWWHTIVGTSSKEKTGYPTQKPLGVLRRIVAASSSPGDLVLDCFAGSGTTGAAAFELGRRFLLIDQSEDAWSVMRRRFADLVSIEWSDYRSDTAPARESG